MNTLSADFNTGLLVSIIPRCKSSYNSGWGFKDIIEAIN